MKFIVYAQDPSGVGRTASCFDSEIAAQSGARGNQILVPIEDVKSALDSLKAHIIEELRAEGLTYDHLYIIKPMDFHAVMGLKPKPDLPLVEVVMDRPTFGEAPKKKPRRKSK